jgi:hypothetical protein
MSEIYFAHAGAWLGNELHLYISRGHESSSLRRVDYRVCAAHPTPTGPHIAI